MDYRRIMLLILFYLSIILISSSEINARKFVHGNTINKDLPYPTMWSQGSKLSSDEDVLEYKAGYVSYFSTFYGGSAKLSVHHPQLETNQVSVSSLWIHTGLYGQKDFNCIQTGWWIQKDYFDDDYPHFIIYWGTNSSMGCMNSECGGLVLHDKPSIMPGEALKPLSNDSDSYYDISIQISMNRSTGDWWIYFGRNGNFGPVGYLPNHLFTDMARAANNIVIGGIVSSTQNKVLPAMGNGYLPNNANAAYIKDIKYIIEDGSLYTPNNKDEFKSTDKARCYDVGEFNNGSFIYGGPAGCN